MKREGINKVRKFRNKGRRNYVKEEMEIKIKEGTNKHQIRFGKCPLLFGPE